MPMTPGFEDLSHLGACARELVLDDGSRLYCEEIVRVVPGKRIVLRGRRREQAVYAKLFVGKGAQRYADRDRRGVEALQAAGIATPALLHAGLCEGVAHTLVFAAVTDSVNAEQAWASMTHEQRRVLAGKLVAEVARHHAAGLMQSDLYLKNFLLQADQRILTLDGDAIRPLPRLGRERAARANLAGLLSKFDVEDEIAWLPSLLAEYAEIRGLSVVPALPAMRKQAAACRIKAINRYAERKVFRQCTDVEVRRGWQRYAAIVRGGTDEKTRNVLAEPEALMDHAERLLKQGHTCTVALTMTGPLKVVVKRYNIKSFWHGMSRAWRPSRAASSWSNAHRLGMAGIATPPPLALVERRWGPLRREAWFLAQYVEAPNVGVFFAEVQHELTQKAEVAERIARMFHNLYLLGLAHGDLKANNILVAQGQPVLIDLDAMRQYRCRRLFRRHHLSDLRRFMRNWQDPAAQKIFAAAFARVYRNPALLRMAGINEEI